MRAIIITLALLVLSGCIGLPEGTADIGDTASIRYVAFDLDTGEPLAWTLTSIPTTTENGFQVYAATSARSALMQAFEGQIPAAYDALFVSDGQPRTTVSAAAMHGLILARGEEMAFARSLEFVVGSGESGLGLDVERQMRGVEPGKVSTITSREDRTRSYYETRETDDTIGPFDITRVISRQEFSRTGQPAEVGARFTFNGLYDAEVTQVDEGSLTYRVLAEDGRRDPIPQLGIILETQIIGDQWTWKLIPDVGKTFVIQPPSQFQRETPLGLDPGSYQTLGMHGEHILYGYNPTLRSDVLGHPVRVTFEVTSVTQGTSEIPTGDYGSRDSPVLRSMAEAPKADGHDDHGHTH